MAKYDFLAQTMSFRSQKSWKNGVFSHYLQNPPSKKVLTHLKIFVWVFERPLHWQNAYAILFFLNLLLAGCATLNNKQITIISALEKTHSAGEKIFNHVV